MSSATPATNPSATIGLAWALLGVLAFSFTFPMTHIALQDFDALFIGVGRGALSGIGAILLLWISRSPWPTRQQWPPLLVIVIGVCVGFPVFSAYALTEMPAGHAGIITGVMPLATALFALRRSHDKPKTAFWMAALLGSLGVISFEIWRNGLDMQLSSLWMLLAVILGAAGYAEGAHLTKDMGGWRVISWALAISCLPLSILSLYLLPTELPTQTSTWLAFAYVALISQWLGFFPWYKGLAQAGIARAAQMQLLMPFFTLLTAWWLIDEALQAVSLWFALWVSLAVALAQRAHRPAASNSSGKPAGKRLLKALLLSLLVLACSACRVDHPQPAEPPGCSGCP